LLVEEGHRTIVRPKEHRLETFRMCTNQTQVQLTKVTRKDNELVGQKTALWEIMQLAQDRVAFK
jgi:hypothetical protein